MSIKHSIVKFKFEDFAGLTEEKGDYKESQTIKDCHGNSWVLKIYPRGSNKSVDDNMIALALYYGGTNEVSARATFIVRDASGKAYADRMMNVHTFQCSGNSGRGKDAIKRSDILNEENNILVDGALHHVDVHIQIQPDSLVAPPNLLAKNMLIILDDEVSADAQFKVKRQIITAHKCILKPNSPILFEFCKDSNEGEMIQIENVRPDIFRIVLRFIYAGELPDIDTIRKNGMKIIEAADKFGVIPLKLAIETELVRNLLIKRFNVTNYLIFAEAKTCSLLKEAAMSYFVTRATDLLNSETREKLSESPDLLIELMTEMSKRNDTDTRFGEYGNLSVNDLRKRLADEELDIDGSKESLVSRLTESAKKKQRTE